jgi:hypothetical protein
VLLLHPYEPKSRFKYRCHWTCLRPKIWACCTTLVTRLSHTIFYERVAVSDSRPSASSVCDVWLLLRQERHNAGGRDVGPDPGFVWRSNFPNENNSVCIFHISHVITRNKLFLFGYTTTPAVSVTSRVFIMQMGTQTECWEAGNKCCEKQDSIILNLHTFAHGRHLSAVTSKQFLAPDHLNCREYISLCRVFWTTREQDSHHNKSAIVR